MAAPKLLDKRTVTAEVATQRAQQIKEGLVLAKKVDILRETLQDESGKLDSFRTETVAKVQAEIDAKIFEKDRLGENLVPMRLEYERLLTPPDLTEKWEEVRTLERNLKGEKEILFEGQITLRHATSLNIQRERENRIESDRIADERKRTTKELVAAQEGREGAQDILKKAREKSKIMNAAIALRESEVAEREQIAIKSEMESSEKLEKIERYEAELANREVALKDGWRELEKTQKELNI